MESERQKGKQRKGREREDSPLARQKTAASLSFSVLSSALASLEGGQAVAREDGGMCETRGCRRRSGGREDVEHEPAIAAGEKMLRVHKQEAGRRLPYVGAAATGRESDIGEDDRDGEEKWRLRNGRRKRKSKGERETKCADVRV
jgi:hypothetical protein